MTSVHFFDSGTGGNAKNNTSEPGVYLYPCVWRPCSESGQTMRWRK